MTALALKHRSTSHSKAFEWAFKTEMLPVLPAFVVIVMGFLWPLGTMLTRSFSPKGEVSINQGFTFEHYLSLFKSDVLRSVTIETFALAFYATVITLILAFPTAYLVSRLSRRTAMTLIALITIPFWVSILLRLFAFTVILGREGLINNVFGLFGLGPFELIFNTPATVVGMVAYLLPYLILVLYAAMGSIDTSLMTAAKTMGASGRQAFFHIYLPQVRAAVVSGTTLVFVLALSFFLTPAILGGPRNITLPQYIQQKVQVFEWGTASAAGITLLVVSVLGFMMAIKVGGTSVLGYGGRPVGRGAVQREPLPFSATTILLWVFLLINVLILLLPLVIIIPASFGASNQIHFPPHGFTTSWYSEVVSDSTWIEAFLKSVRVGLGTALLSLIVGLGLARTSSKVTSAFVRNLIQTIAFAPLVVPGILLAIGIYDVQLQLGSVGTDWGLILGHSVFAFPLVFIIISNAIAKLDGSLEPAAWSMGASRIRVFWTIVIPNLMPAIIGGLVISFLTSFDEVVVALFQTGIDKTLPVVIFSLVQTGVTPAVAAVATLLILPVVIGVILAVLSNLRRDPAK